MSVGEAIAATIVLYGTATGVASAIGHQVESKNKEDSFVSTIGKMIQCIPGAYLLGLAHYSSIKSRPVSIHQPAPWKESARLAHLAKVALVSTTVFFIIVPLVLHGLKSMAKRWNMQKTYKVLDSLDTLYMLAVRIFSVASMVISGLYAILLSGSFCGTLTGALFLGLAAVNLTSLIFSVDPLKNFSCWMIKRAARWVLRNELPAPSPGAS